MDEATERQVRKSRNVRVEDDLWSAVQAKAAHRGDTVSELIRDALKRYLTPGA